MTDNIQREALVRLSVNMNVATADALKALATQRGVSYTETVRRAISIAHYLDREQRAGRTILIRDDDAKTVKEVLWA